MAKRIFLLGRNRYLGQIMARDTVAARAIYHSVLLIDPTDTNFSPTGTRKGLPLRDLKFRRQVASVNLSKSTITAVIPR